MSYGTAVCDLRLAVRMPERNEDAVRNSQWATQTARSDFNEARRRALLAALRDIFRGQPNTMLSFEEVRARLNVRWQRYLGRKVVPLDHIIGSEGRYIDFDRRFLP